MPPDSPRSRTSKTVRAPEPLADEVHVLVTLDRKTGRVTFDDEFSTPMETWGMLSTASALASDRVDASNGIESV